MKLLGSTIDIIDADKNSENVPRLENVEVVLVHCNLVNNSYQQHSRVLFTFVPTRQYGQLISISPHSLVFLKTMNTDFSEIEVWFTDQNNNVLEIEDNVINLLLVNVVLFILLNIFNLAAKYISSRTGLTVKSIFKKFLITSHISLYFS